MTTRGERDKIEATLRTQLAEAQQALAEARAEGERLRGELAAVTEAARAVVDARSVHFAAMQHADAHDALMVVWSSIRALAARIAGGVR